MMKHHTFIEENPRHCVEKFEEFCLLAWSFKHLTMEVFERGIESFYIGLKGFHLNGELGFKTLHNRQ